ncbi:flagellar basal body L-ring protein FlgH [Gimibacter soli]|uniref:Flagellar L-ring protein n=1 Tax=Gimibacter soli TaxID=3024400 RepID=A0AAF0BG03_9PROT|nr:flagellar basal body L-ring protein FlgH [Gimibacter soli]WCL53038.1 flagellar basal body L-ring protein FlgH [Gimibacter soli]
MKSYPLKKSASLLMALALGACGAMDRMSEIGKEPAMTPISNVAAPAQQRSISLPMPSQEPQVYQANSLWRTGARAFFKDQRAAQVGDILTVEINIEDQAKIGNSTARSRTTAEGAGLPNMFGLETLIGRGIGQVSGTAGAATDTSNLVTADSSSSYAGTGTVDRSESISLTVAAIVTEVLPNGNLVIQGRQEVRVNFEKRELLLAGIVRPEDISSGNTIQHTQIAEARISYGGKGQITDVQQPRYGTQLYDIIFPF